MDYVTIKQVADLCEKSDKVIRTWIQQVYPDKMKQGVETKLSNNEVEYLFKKVFGEKITFMLMQQLVPNGKSNISQTGQVEPNNFGVEKPKSTDPFDAAMMDALNAQAKAIQILKQRQDNIQRTMLNVIAPEIRRLKEKNNLLLEDKRGSIEEAKKLLRDIHASTEQELDDFIEKLNGNFSWLY